MQLLGRADRLVLHRSHQVARCGLQQVGHTVVRGRDVQ